MPTRLELAIVTIEEVYYRSELALDVIKNTRDDVVKVDAIESWLGAIKRAIHELAVATGKAVE